MTIYDMRRAIKESESVMAAADSHVACMAEIVSGRLRQLPHRTLCKIKRELRNFDMVAKTWK